MDDLDSQNQNICSDQSSEVTDMKNDNYMDVGTQISATNDAGTKSDADETTIQNQSEQIVSYLGGK